MKKIFTLLAILLGMGLSSYAATPPTKLTEKLEITGLTERGKQLAKEVSNEFETKKSQKKHAPEAREESGDWQYGMRIYGRLTDYLSIGSSSSFDDFPFYLVQAQIWNDEVGTSIPVFLCWPSEYAATQLKYNEENGAFEELPLEERDYTMVSLEKLANNPDICSDFEVSNYINWGNVVSFQMVYTILPPGFFGWSFDIDGQTIETMESGSLSLSNCVKGEETYSVNASFEIIGKHNDVTGEHTYEFKHDYSGPVQGNMGVVEPEVVQDYYIYGVNVNGQENVYAQEDAKFTYMGAGIYEWRGGNLGCKFLINDGTDNPENSWGAPDIHYLIDAFAYAPIEKGSAEEYILSIGQAIYNPVIQFMPENNIVYIKSLDSITPYEWQVSGTGFDSPKELTPREGGSYTANLNLNGEGELMIVSVPEAIYFGANEEGQLLSEVSEMTRFSDYPLSFKEPGNILLTFVPANGSITLEELGNLELYIIGNNVNGQYWQLAQEDAKFQYDSERDVYVWRGDYLGSSFKINDGTWGGTNIGSGNGELIDIDEQFYYYDGSSQNIGFTNFMGVINPEVTLDYTNGWLMVSGEKSGETFDWYFLNEANEGSDEFYSQPFQKVNDGEYVIDEMTFDGEPVSFKFGNYGLATTYTPADPIDAENLESHLYSGTSVAYGTITLTGRYSITFYPYDNYVVFSDLDNPTPIVPDYVEVTVSNSSGSSLVFYLSSLSWYVLGYKVEEGWAVEDITCETEGTIYTLGYDDSRFEIVPLKADAQVNINLKYDGEIEFLDYESGTTEIGSAGYKVTVGEGQVALTGLDGSENITVFTVGGQTIANYQNTADKLVIKLERNNTYIIRIGNEAVKVFIR